MLLGFEARPGGAARGLVHALRVAGAALLIMVINGGVVCCFYFH